MPETILAPTQKNLVVTRTIFTDLSTIGTLTFDGHEYHTLEPPRREEKPRCIPPGTYDVTIRWSEKHKRLVPHVENVPGFSEIEIHIGNFPHDTEGCLLVGATQVRPNEIEGSRIAFDEIFSILSDAKSAGEPITITYIEEGGEGA